MISGIFFPPKPLCAFCPLVFPHPHRRLSAKLNIPVFSHAFMQQSFNIYALTHQRDLARSHSVIQFMMLKNDNNNNKKKKPTIQCPVKATCTHILVIVHILTQQYKGMGAVSHTSTVSARTPPCKVHAWKGRSEGRRCTWNEFEA